MGTLFEFAYTPYILPLLLATLTLLIVMARTWRFRKQPLGRVFLRLLIALQIWTLGFVIEMMARSLDGKLFWANIQFFGILPLPLFWLEIILLLTGRTRDIKKCLLICGIPILFVLGMIWTDSFHHLFRANPYLDCITAPFCILVSNYGPAFYLNTLISYPLFTATIFIITRSLAITKPLYRQQLIMLLLSLAIPLATDVLYVIGISPISHYNFTPITFSVAAVFVAIALFWFRLFSIRPLAYDLIIENMSDGILILDNENLVVDINPAAQELLGMTSKQAIGESVETLLIKWPGLVERFLDVSSLQTTINIQQEERTEYFDIRISPVINKSGLQTGRAVTIRDVTERMALLQKVEHLATTDTLTGLHNRGYFSQLCEREILQAIRYHRPLSLLMLDLDHFKQINDTYGHATGDFALKEIAWVLQDVIRRSDLVGRYGGEEFTILLPETGIDSAVETARRIRDLVSNRALHYENSTFNVTTSIGVTEFQESQSSSLSELINAADQALYRAKSLGRNRIEC